VGQQWQRLGALKVLLLLLLLLVLVLVLQNLRLVRPAVWWGARHRTGASYQASSSSSSSSSGCKGVAVPYQKWFISKAVMFSELTSAAAAKARGK
jgi:hypothetical protein